MRKRVQIALAVLIVATLGMITWRFLRAREPVFQGRPVSWWVDHLGEGVPTTSANSPHDSQVLGSNAIPVLMMALERRDGPLQRMYQSAWPKLPLWMQKRLPMPRFAGLARANAAFLLGTIGAPAKPAVPTLLRIIKEDQDYRARAMAASSLGKLAARDDAVTAALLDEFQKKDKNDIDHTAHSAVYNALMQIDPEAAARAGLK